MDDAIKQMTKAQLKEEERALKEIKKMYEKARKDMESQISALAARKDMNEHASTIINQAKYQAIIIQQIDGVLDALNKGQFKTTQDFLNSSYVNGYVGLMYSLQKQTDCTLLMPIDSKKIVRAVKTDSKLSTKYYQNRELPENLSVLKRNIRQQVTRGIASEMTWTQVANQIAHGMNSPFNRAMSDAMRIVRTEGHRINQEGFLDAGNEAKKKGADIVKQWDATLDGVTRPAHKEADGQIREWNEKFIVGGEEMEAPSVGGSAFNVCNCRCRLLQRARWMLDEDELNILKDRANFFELDKKQSFQDFKEKYVKLPKTEKAIIKAVGEFHDISATTTKLKGAMKRKDYDEFMKIVQNNPDIAFLYDTADGIGSVEYVSGSGICWGKTGLEFGYPNEKYIQEGVSKFSTLAHEYGHYFDTLTYERGQGMKDIDGLTFEEYRGLQQVLGSRSNIDASASDQFLSAMRKDGKKIKEHLSEVRSYCMQNLNTSKGVQDAIDGFGFGRIVWGHGDRYYNTFYNNRVVSKWDKDYKKEVKEYYASLGFDVSNDAKVKKVVRQYATASELWANVASAVTCGGKELETIKKHFPETVDAFLEISKKLVK